MKIVSALLLLAMVAIAGIGAGQYLVSSTQEPQLIGLVRQPAPIQADNYRKESIATKKTATPLPAAPPASPLQPSVEQPTVVPIQLPQLPTVAPSPTTPPIVNPAQLPSAMALGGLTHQWQTWNNCGPATLSMALSYYGSTLDQAAIALNLRYNDDDKNVNPSELAAAARELGYQATLRVNGDAEILHSLLSNDIPVLIETWLEPEPDDGFGHYRLLTGYDDEDDHWIAYDSYVGVGLVNPDGEYQGIRLPFAETDELWKVFNRTYIVIYTPAQASIVTQILDDRDGMWEESASVARAEIDQNRADAQAWFNLGTSLTAMARYADAAGAFDEARNLGLGWRMLWYQFAPFEAYYYVGRHKDVIALADQTLALDVQIEELLYWRGRSLEATGFDERAAVDRTLAQTLNPGYEQMVQSIWPVVENRCA